jgi:hypothetical protein
MRCVCCGQIADKERDGNAFCMKCLAEIVELEKPEPSKKPDWIIEIPGLVKIGGYNG